MTRQDKTRQHKKTQDKHKATIILIQRQDRETWKFGVHEREAACAAFRTARMSVISFPSSCKYDSCRWGKAQDSQAGRQEEGEIWLVTKAQDMDKTNKRDVRPQE
jgi:hypothetical protein